MGYAVIAWIDERPIRHALQVRELNEVALAMGEAMFDLLSQYPYGAHGSKNAQCLGSPCVHGVTTVHSTWESLFEWGPDGLRLIGGLDDENFDQRLEELHTASSLNYVLPLRGRKRQDLIMRIAAKSTPSSDAQLTEGFASVYWIYEDWYRGCIRKEADWPAWEVGKAMINLMTLKTEYGAAIASDGNAINKAATLLDDRPTAFLWAQNCLRHVSELPKADPPQLKRMGLLGDLDELGTSQPFSLSEVIPNENRLEQPFGDNEE